MDHQGVVMMMVTMTIVVLLAVTMVDGGEEMKEDGQIGMIVVVTRMNAGTMRTIGDVMIVLGICPHHSDGEMRADEIL